MSIFLASLVGWAYEIDGLYVQIPAKPLEKLEDSSHLEVSSKLGNSKECFRQQLNGHIDSIMMLFSRGYHPLYAVSYGSN